MPWNDQNNGSGPKGPIQGPWGTGPTGGNNGGGGPPDLEKFLAQLRARWMPGGGMSAGGISALVLLALVLWALTGFYTVGTNQVGINTVFGRYTGKTEAGLNYNFPWPVGSVDRLAVTDRNSIDIGERTQFDGQVSDIPAESLMLTGDENIADVKFRVIWQIDPAHPEYYAFNMLDRVNTVRAVSESAMREVVGQNDIQGLLTVDRNKVELAVKALVQRVLDSYKSGVSVLEVQLLSVDPPAEVIAAYKDVSSAQQDERRLQNEADAYRNKVVPEARGAAAAIVQSAKAYREQTVAEATGQASRFDQIYQQYKLAPDVTRERLYLETMEKVLGGANKIILDTPKGGGAVPYLPLDQLLKKGTTP
ncbi:MAG: FtsH protease activity modulator HflK [Hyphomicrobiales bacterium]|nr:FtsH protease activity modulator HflK [Hyphomicrobiales bacterium]MDE2115889.1 FtsH protease activity modulator HflK [Hyphomicrobiales bacterium]